MNENSPLSPSSSSPALFPFRDAFEGQCALCNAINSLAYEKSSAHGKSMRQKEEQRIRELKAHLFPIVTGGENAGKKSKAKI
jgi:hypothetical protein